MKYLTNLELYLCIKTGEADRAELRAENNLLRAALLACADRLDMAASDARGRNDPSDAAGYHRLAERTRAALAGAQ